MVFGKQSLQGICIESTECQRSSSGKYSQESQCEPENFKDRIIFMSMYNDIEWKAEGNKEQCEYNSQTVANYALKFTRGHGLSWKLDHKKSGTEPTLTNQMDPVIVWQKK